MAAAAVLEVTLEAATVAAVAAAAAAGDVVVEDAAAAARIAELLYRSGCVRERPRSGSMRAPRG